MSEDVAIPLTLLKDAITMPRAKFALLEGQQLKPFITAAKLEESRGGSSFPVIPRSKVQELLDDGTLVLHIDDGHLGKAADTLVRTYDLKRPTAASV